MYVTYFDEVKAIPENGQDRYWVGGICLTVKSVKTVDERLSQLAKEIFGSTELTEGTEFHAKNIYFGKFPTRNWKMEKRLAILEKLFDVLTDGTAIKRVYASIDSTRLYDSSKAGEYAFAHFCERVQLLLGRKEATLLIGDMDAQQSATTIREFSQYRKQGTPWEYGIEINSIVDCVHFAHSHHSRMVQLADFYLFAASHASSSRAGDMAVAFSAILKKADFYAHKYKWWPNE